MIEIEAGGTSSKLNQFDEDGKVGTQINGTGAASFNAGNVDAYFGDARRAAFYIEDARLGRLTVGRYETAGAITTIDLGGISAGASASMILVNGSFLIRGPNGEFFATTWGALGDPSANQGRAELIRYDSPSLHGFIFSASLAEAGDYWGVMLRYANEFNGVRVAAGIGWEGIEDRQTSVAGTAGPNDLLVPRPEVEAWGASLALLHVPTGLFAQGHYMAAEFSCNANALSLSQSWGQAADCKSDAKQWLIQAGITRNWFGIGNTAFFGEYGKSTDFGSTLGAGRDYAAAGGSVAINNVIGTEMTVWGFGVTQNLDAAATELYLDYRHFSADIDCSTSCTTGAGPAASLATEDFGVVIGGARVKF
jgi:hypothetical protein